MKKVIITIIIAVLLSLISCSNNSSVQNEESDQKSQLLSSMIQYDVSGKELSKETYIYNDQGQLIEENSISEGYSTKTTYIYNKNGKLQEETQTNLFDGKKETHTFKYEYDLTDNLIEKNKINETGAQISQITYEYDNDNRLIKIFDDALKQTTSYIYNEGQKLSVKSEYNIDGKTIFNIIDYELDIYGNIIHEIAYLQNSTEAIEQEKYNNYDKTGQIINSQTYILGELVESVEYEYNNMLLIRKIFSDDFGIYLIEEFEYNEYGNIIKQIRKSRSNVTLNYIVFEYQN